MVHGCRSPESRVGPVAGKLGEGDRLPRPAPGPRVYPASFGPLSPQALLALLCWLWHGLAHPASWLQPPGPPATPPGSPPCSLLLDSSLSSNWDDESIGWVRCGRTWTGIRGDGLSSWPNSTPETQDP